jgi:DNA-binding LacI/PurR family transcriptional regulator
MLNHTTRQTVDGILIVTTGECHETIQQVNELGCDRDGDRGDPALNLDAVGVDNVQAAEMPSDT